MLPKPSPSGPQKAKIVVYRDRKGAEGQVKETIECKFNPSEISFSKTAKWQASGADQAQGQNAGATQKQKNLPSVEFGGGEAASMKLDLFFDTTDTGKDVRKVTDKLVALTLIDTTIKTPPLIRFIWGSLQSFLAYVTSVSVTFKMFLPNGTPVRATVALSLTQYGDDKVFQKQRQNPTSFSEAKKMWVVSEGERLDWIAYQEYGDAAHWRHIAQTNNLSNPFDLRPGQILKLTPLE